VTSMWCLCGRRLPASHRRIGVSAAERVRAIRRARNVEIEREMLRDGDDIAQMALEAGDKSTALTHAREARRLATCDGPPDYTYKVAYEEAGRLVEELG